MATHPDYFERKRIHNSLLVSKKPFKHCTA
jgi:hypothetical protein